MICEFEGIIRGDAVDIGDRDALLEWRSSEDGKHRKKIRASMVTRRQPLRPCREERSQIAGPRGWVARRKHSGALLPRNDHRKAVLLVTVEGRTQSTSRKE